MAFENKNLARVSAGPNAGNNVINIFTYFSMTDTTEDMLVNDYFDEAFGILSLEDIIHVCGALDPQEAALPQQRMLFVDQSDSNAVIVTAQSLLGTDAAVVKTNEAYPTLTSIYSTSYGQGSANWVIPVKTGSVIIDAWLAPTAAGGSGAEVILQKDAGAAVIADFITTPTVIGTRKTADLINRVQLTSSDTISLDYPAGQTMAFGRLYIMSINSVT